MVEILGSILNGSVDVGTPAPPDQMQIGVHFTTASGTNPGEIDVTILGSPNANGGTPEQYQYELDEGSWNDTGGLTSFTITGLTPGQSYNVEVRLKTSIGEGPDSPNNVVQATPDLTGGGGGGSGGPSDPLFDYTPTFPSVSTRSNLVVLSGDFEYDQYRLFDPTDTFYDCSGATFRQKNQGSPTNVYPAFWDRPHGVTVYGATVEAEIPLTNSIDRVDLYVNSAGLFFRHGSTTTPPMVFSGCRIIGKDPVNQGTWDGIRTDTQEEWRVEHCYVGPARDEGLENDRMGPGTVENCYFKDQFSWFSAESGGSYPNGPNNTVNVLRCIVSMKAYLHKGNITHQAPFKWDATDAPNIYMENSVIAIEDVNHESITGRLVRSFNKMTAVNSYWLNISDDDLPSAYPDFPSGITYIQGQAARDFLAERVAEWEALNTWPKPAAA